MFQIPSLNPFGDMSELFLVMGFMSAMMIYHVLFCCLPEENMETSFVRYIYFRERDWLVTLFLSIC